MDKTQFSKSEIIMTTIKWVNDTFTPLGMHPIEDLPKAVPQEGASCVVAQAIKENMDVDSIHVGYIDVAIANKDYGDFKHYAFPAEVQQFIRGFDSGEYPEFVVDGYEWQNGVWHMGDDDDCECAQCYDKHMENDNGDADLVNEEINND